MDVTAYNCIPFAGTESFNVSKIDEALNGTDTKPFEIIESTKNESLGN